ncbi:oligosaccharide flippase family protein [Mucilaginibacter sp.]|uniref:oligosaccharide flippase family protein n=1 Tax=Mucilaginibacter sp. TaxID=1882438 RepID=UPI0028496536|nr:oligosaccharide flippase family protein [Mucilaginibacter sp.]MDR3696832.1 oligosaccharide flippase family protein [Mucilaginibacter sp.]
MKKGLVQNLSVNAGQLIINQLLGLGIFYVLSTGLDKNSFGQINLVLAILLSVFNILSFGMDQMVVKKIAGGRDTSSVLSIYLVHVLISGLIFYGLILAGSVFFHNRNELYSLLLLIGIGKLMIFFSTPFKQAANGMERFRLMAYMSVISNLVRCSGLIILAILHHLSLHNVIFIFIGGDIIELVFCVYLFNHSTKIPVTLKWDSAGYKKLLLESLPQTGVVLITSALARFDWIFIGFMVSAVKLAEYSFAYKIFEISTLPLLAIAPLLIPRFTKLFQSADIRVGELKFLVRMEMILAAFTGLLLNLCWSPVIDRITSGKYGLINIKTIFILSLCLPVLYLNNFLWTVYFAQGRLKMILISFILTFLVNVLGDILLIPFFKNEGAAFAFLAACIVQSVYYLKQGTFPELKSVWQPLIPCTLCALVSGFLSRALFPDSWLVLPAAILVYLGLLFVSTQLRISDGKSLRRLFN